MKNNIKKRCICNLQRFYCYIMKIPRVISRLPCKGSCQIIRVVENAKAFLGKRRGKLQNEAVRIAARSNDSFALTYWGIGQKPFLLQNPSVKIKDFATSLYKGGWLAPTSDGRIGLGIAGRRGRRPLRFDNLNCANLVGNGFIHSESVQNKVGGITPALRFEMKIPRVISRLPCKGSCRNRRFWLRDCLPPVLSLRLLLTAKSTSLIRWRQGTNDLNCRCRICLAYT